jgi:hypothetical protein
VKDNDKQTRVDTIPQGCKLLSDSSVKEIIGFCEMGLDSGQAIHKEGTFDTS